jgi:hypothetical protein
MSQNPEPASPQSTSSYAIPHVTGAPLLPCSTASLLAANPHVPEETMHQIAAGLLRTIEERKLAHNTKVWELREKLLRFEELVGDEDSDEPPQGYVRNNGKIPNFDIPMDEGLYLPAKWVKLHGRDYTKALSLTSKELSVETPYSMEIYTSPDICLNEVPEPLPLWVQTIIEGQTMTFEALRQAAIELEDWGIMADLTRTRDIYLKAQEMELQRDQIEADLSLLQEKYVLARGRLELACVSKRLARQQYLVPAVLWDDENFPQVPPKGKNVKQGRFAV